MLMSFNDNFRKNFVFSTVNEAKVWNQVEAEPLSYKQGGGGIQWNTGNVHWIFRKEEITSFFSKTLYWNIIFHPADNLIIY